MRWHPWIHGLCAGCAVQERLAGGLLAGRSSLSLVLGETGTAGGSCPAMTLTVNRSRLAETLLFFPLLP